MENVFELHQYTYCLVMHIGKKEAITYIHSTSKRRPEIRNYQVVSLDASISYNKQRTDVTRFGGGSEEKRDEDDIVVDNFQDGLYNLFKKDKETWDEEDKFLMKAVSDYLPLVVKKSMEEKELKIQNFDLLHYAFIVPSEWEEEIRDDIFRPIFIQSGLISNQDHQERLLFFTDIESLCYNYSFKRGQNTVFCRVTPEEEEITVKFDLIQTATTLFNIPNAKLFSKAMKSSSVSFTYDNIQGRIKEILREHLFPMAAANDDSVRELRNPELVPSEQNQIIEAIMEEINSKEIPTVYNTVEEKDPEEEPWITLKEDWILSKDQKEFVNSLCPSTICAETNTFLLDYMKNIISNNFTKSYNFLLVRDYRFSDWNYILTWVEYILQYNSRFLNYVIDSDVKVINHIEIIKGASEAVFEAIQHSDIYCKPRIVSSEDLTLSSSVFLSSNPDVIINMDISLGSTLFTCSILDEDGLVQQIYDHDYFIQDNHLPSLGYFFTFSDNTALNVKEQFILFVGRYLGDLIADDGVSIKRDTLLEMKDILSNGSSDGELLVSTDKQKYIKGFILMYMIYIKKEILYKFFDKFISDQTNIKIGYAVSIEAMLLNKTLESKNNLRDIIYESGLVPKDDHSKKLRITTQGERILPAIQKSLKLELPLKSYFLLCQLHEDYVQLSLHQVVTASSPEEKEQESIIVQDEILSIHNIYDSLCSSMWYNLLQDSSLIELCEMHNTSDNNKILDLFSPKVKAAFFTNLKGHISDNVFQNNPNMQSTNTVNLTSSCNCKVRLTTSDIIDISFTPVLQDVARTLSASLLNKKLFGNYMNINYLFSFIRFNNSPQRQYAFEKILKEEANNFNFELGIETSYLVVPELFNHLLKPVIGEQPLCYKDFKIGVLQQVCKENYVFNLNGRTNLYDVPFTYKSKITDTKTIDCSYEIYFPFLNKGEVILNNVQLSRKFYLRNGKDRDCFYKAAIDIYKFETMNYMENNETLFREDNIYQHVGDSIMYFGDYYALEEVDIPVMVSIRYVSYTSSFQFSAKIIGPDTAGDEYLMGVTEIGEPLTLTRL